MACSCSAKPIILLVALLALSVVYLWAVKQPTAAQWKVFIHFVTVECGESLFVKNIWAVVPIALAGMAPVWVWYAPFIGLSLLGAINSTRFYYYYFVSAQYPAIVAKVTAAIANQSELVKWVFPVCTTPGGCSIRADENANVMIGLWWDDAAWLFVVFAAFVIVDGIRYRILPHRLLAVVLAAAFFGWDTVAPIWFLWLRVREETFATYAEPKTEFARKSGSGIVLYSILALLSVSMWWPPLYDWALTRGTVSGQLTDGMANPFGARATIIIMGTFWTWTVFFLHQISVGSGAAGFVMTWLLRTVTLFLFMGHVAGAAATVLLFREFRPDQTYVESPEETADAKKLKDA